MVIKLLKNRIYTFLTTVNGGFKRKFDIKSILKITPLVLLYIFVQSIAGVTFFLKYPVKTFVNSGNEIEGLFLFACIIFSLCFGLNMLTIPSQLIDANDNDLLLSMPIKHSIIVRSRLISLYLINLFITLILGISYLWSYKLVGGTISARFLIIYFTELTALVFFILGLACFVYWLINIVAKIFYSAAYLLTMFIGFGALIIGCCCLYYFITFSEGTNLSFLKKIMLIIYCFSDSVISTKYSSVILFISLFIFVIAELLISKWFLRIFSSSQKKNKRINNIKKVNTDSCLISMIKKEIVLITKEKQYLLNAGLGCIFLIILSFVVVFDKSLLFKISNKKDVTAIFLLAIPCLSSIMNLFSASSISLEGKSLWLPKSLPIRANLFFLSKAFAHTFMSLLPIVLFATVANIYYDMSILLRIYIYILPLSLSLLISFLGILVNVRFPVFDFVSVVTAVKQGISTIVLLFISGLISSVLILLYLILHKFIINEVYLSVILILTLIVNAILYIIINRKSNAWFEKM